MVRDYNGNIYVIPNGDIRTITNMSRDFKRAIVDIRCPYEADQAHVVQILEEEMEHAADLSVRLETDVHSGSDWYMAK